MKYHDIANIFPKMIPEELIKLSSDIKTNGLINPIVLYEGKILDGRNRYEACQKAKIEPRFEDYTGNKPLEHIISLNLHRRHLNESQRAVVASKIANIQVGDNQYIGSANLPTQISQPKAAKLLNVSERSIRKIKSIERTAPEKIDKIESGEKTIHQVEREIKKEAVEENLKQAQKKISEEAQKSINSVCDLRNCSFNELFASGIQPDVVITDPPYSKEYLPLFNDLAECCQNVPIVAVMCGQTYLPEIIQMMCRHLQYRWMLAYLTPGGQSVQQWQTKVNTFWKPILLFGKADRWIGDVCKSQVNNNDKRFHDWGQSESGMYDVVERLTEPGDLICDPFLGGGTTAVVSLALGRRFVGCDIDFNCIDKTQRRIEANWK